MLGIATIYWDKWEPLHNIGVFKLNEKRKQNLAFICICIFLNDDRNPWKMAEYYVRNISTMCVSQSLASLIAIEDIVPEPGSHLYSIWRYGAETDRVIIMYHLKVFITFADMVPG